MLVAGVNLEICARCHRLHRWQYLSEVECRNKYICEYVKSLRIYVKVVNASFYFHVAFVASIVAQLLLLLALSIVVAAAAATD